MVPEDRQRIVVRQKHIWSDVKRAFKQPGFSDDVGLNVTFIGEPAQDAGGPSRELFRNLFTGPPSARTLVHNVLALQRNEFHVVGHVIALSLMYGGGAPYIFARSVVTYLMDEPIDTTMIDEVPDLDIQLSLYSC